MSSNARNFKDGDIVECLHSASCAYTVGKTYDVYKNQDGLDCIMGDDGIEDICCMLVSSFMQVYKW